jgi:hypothetical protein
MMDYLTIITLIGKGLTVAQALIEAGEAALPAIQAVQNIVSGVKDGAVTEEQLAETEAELDKLIETFNLELPPEA